MISWIKTGLDALVALMNIFPGWKTKAGAVLQVIGTLMLTYHQYLAPMAGFDIPMDVIVSINAAAATLIGIGAANLPTNSKPSQ